MYETTATAVTIARRRRPSRPAIAPTAAATIAMFQPEIATTWLTPAVVNARGDVAIDPIAQADEDPRREPGLGLREDPRQGLAGVAAPRLRGACRDRPGGPGAPSSAHRACPRRRVARGSGRSGLSGRGRVRPPTDDAVARLDRPDSAGSVAASRKPVSAAVRGPDRGDLMPLARRPDGLDDHRPRAAADRATRPAPHPAGPRLARSAIGQHADRRRPGRPTRRARGNHRAAEEQQTGRTDERGDESVVTRRPRPGPRSRRRPPATRCAASQRTVTSSRSFSNVFSPRTPRVRSSSTAANGASSRAAMIFSAVAGPMPGSSSSCACGRGVDVDRPPAAPARRPAGRAALAAGPALAPPARRRATAPAPGRRRSAWPRD